MNIHKGTYIIHGFQSHDDWCRVVKMFTSEFTGWEDDYHHDGNDTALEIVNGRIVSYSLFDSETMLIASTPAIDKEMDMLLTEIGLFAQEMISEDGKLNSQAKISEEFILKNSDGSFNYEIIDL